MVVIINLLITLLQMTERRYHEQNHPDESMGNQGDDEDCLQNLERDILTLKTRGEFADDEAQLDLY